MILFEQGRLADAAARFRELLAQSPQHATAHAMLALTLARGEGQLAEAGDEAARAVGDGPDLPLAHYAMAVVAYERNRDAEAREAIERAISLDQTNAGFHALLAHLFLRKSLWRMALNAADRGLSYEPQHSGCLNARSTALVQLGERDAAAETIEHALAEDPEDSGLHANQGWAMLHRGQPRQAMTHFKEALRLDPTNDWAKLGVVESLKASFFLYRWLLLYFLWMSRLSPQAQNGILFGGFFGYQILKSIAANSPQFRPFITPILLLYTAFALMTWLAGSLLNLLLRLHPVGRHVLTWEQKRTSEIVAGLLLLAAGLFVAAVAFDASPPLLIMAIATFLTTLPASHILACARGWPRWAMLGITLLVSAAGAGAALGIVPFFYVVVLAIASQFAAISLIRIRPRR